MKTRKLFWLFALSIMAVVFAACGGDAATGGGDGDGGGDDSAQASSAVELSQTETIDAPEFGGSISVSYPEGWVVQGEGGAIVIASSQEVAEIQDPSAAEEIPEGAVLISASVIPGEMAGAMGIEGDVNPTAIIETFTGIMSGDDMPEFGDIEELQIDGNDAARTTGSNDLMSATMYAIDNGGNFTFGFGATRPDEVDQHAATIEAILASTTFTASESE